MTLCVVDASVLIKWLKPEGEANLEDALALMAAFGQGTIVAAAPRLLLLEVLNSAARRWQWEAPRLLRLAGELAHLDFQFIEPDPRRVAPWMLAGLTAYDACYVALAEELDSFVVTADTLILRAAGSYARSLSEAAAEIASS